MGRAALLAEYCREQARWRSDKADEYDDDRNTRSGMALLDVARYVERLPENDPRLVHIDKAMKLTEQGRVVEGDEVRHLVRLHCFPGHTGSPSQFLDDIASAAEQDVVNQEWQSGGVDGFT